MTREQGFGTRNQMSQGVLRPDWRPGAFVPPKCWSVLAAYAFGAGESLLLSEAGLYSSSEPCCVQETMAAWIPPRLAGFTRSSGLFRLSLSPS